MTPPTFTTMANQTLILNALTPLLLLADPELRHDQAQAYGAIVLRLASSPDDIAKAMEQAATALAILHDGGDLRLLPKSQQDVIRLEAAQVISRFLSTLADRSIRIDPPFPAQAWP